MPHENTRQSQERDFSLHDNSMDKLYIPENEYFIQEGYYTNDMLADLLRFHRHNPDIIYFIADMLEDGEDTDYRR